MREAVKLHRRGLDGTVPRRPGRLFLAAGGICPGRRSATVTVVGRKLCSPDRERGGRQGMTNRFRASVPLTDDWQHFEFAVADGVGTVTLNRPEKLNPLTFESYADLRDLVLQLPYRDDVRVLVIRGAGKAFCAGGDVNE